MQKPHGAFDSTNDLIIIFTFLFFEETLNPSSINYVYSSEWLSTIACVLLCFFSALGFFEYFYSKKYLNEKVCFELFGRWWMFDPTLGIQKSILTLLLLTALEDNLLSHSIGY